MTQTNQLQEGTMDDIDEDSEVIQRAKRYRMDLEWSEVAWQVNCAQLRASCISMAINSLPAHPEPRAVLELASRYFLFAIGSLPIAELWQKGEAIPAAS